MAFEVSISRVVCLYALFIYRSGSETIFLSLNLHTIFLLVAHSSKNGHIVITSHIRYVFLCK